MNFKTTTAIFGAAVLAALGAPANAASITVANPDFSQFPTGQTASSYLNIGCAPAGSGCAFDDNVTVGWNQTATRSACCDAGQFRIGALGGSGDAFKSDPTFNGAPEPIVFRAINANATQDITTKIAAGVTYTLDVALGFPTTSVDGASVFLTVDGGQQVKATPVGGLTQSGMQNSGNWFDFEAKYTATASNLNGVIDIELFSNNNGNGFGFFGDVRLAESGPSVLSVPEPSTWVMLVGGFGLMGAFAWRKRRFATV